MIFTQLGLHGACIIEPDPIQDERGFFARVWCREEFESNGLNSNLVQCNLSYNYTKGVLRGMHYQVLPHEEAKVVRCIRGAVYDVIIDLRPESETFKKWMAVELTADNRKMLYIPEGFAHGFQTLVDDTELFYQMSEYYHPETARGVRWNDPAFGIEWPAGVKTISAKDQSYDFFESYA